MFRRFKKRHTSYKSRPRANIRAHYEHDFKSSFFVEKILSILIIFIHQNEYLRKRGRSQQLYDHKLTFALFRPVELRIYNKKTSYANELHARG